MRHLLLVSLLGLAACGGGSESSAADARVEQPECTLASDCDGDRICVAGECAAATCDDNLASPGESDIDCGGDECPACTEGQSCAGPGDCASSFCDGGVCRDCEVPEDCAPVPGTLCVAGMCVGDNPLGQSCQSDNQCASGFCVDSVCCDSRCSGLCASCLGSQTGASSGTCADSLNNTDPDDECTMDAASTCGQNGMCDGAGGCALYSPFTVCGPSMCIGMTYTDDARCDGNGTCEPGETFPCEDTCQFGFCTPL